MANYIFVDKDGKELRRQAMTRGRPRKDAVKQPSGDYIITEGVIPAPVTPVPVTPVPVTPVPATLKPVETVTPAPATPVANTVPTPVAETSKETISTKRIKAKQQVKVVETLKKCFTSVGGIVQDENYIYVWRPDTQVEDLGITVPSYYSSYAKFQIDKKTGDLMIWIMRPNGPPDKVVEGVFSDADSELPYPYGKPA